MKKILVFLMASVLGWGTARLFQKSVASRQFLSHREREILRLVAEGCTNHEIATYLHLREERTDKYLRNILSRLNARDISSAIEYAIEKGLLSVTYA